MGSGEVPSQGFMGIGDGKVSIRTGKCSSVGDRLGGQYVTHPFSEVTSEYLEQNKVN
jgi:hypothetical protein